MTDRSTDIDAFIAQAGWSETRRTHVAGDASNRRYDRLQKSDGSTAILMDAPPAKGESVAPFIHMTNHLRKIGLSAPEIYARDEPLGLLLIEDFGNQLFADLMRDDADQQVPLYRAAADVLRHLQKAQNPVLPVCDTAWLVDMIDPLFEWYAPNSTPAQVRTFQATFRPLAETLSGSPRVLILRDFHAQNLLLLKARTGVGRVGLLDFQDAMLGHPAYDLVSILQDARRDVPPQIEAKIMDYMIEITDQNAATFQQAYALLGLQRNLRILGIFARLCLRDGKADYISLIPRVWRYVERNLAHPHLAALNTTLLDTLPQPTPDFLEHLKRQCPHPNSQP